MRDQNKAKVLFCLNMVKGGVHQIQFFQGYQVLLIAGYENSIPVFSITPRFYDLTVIGRLVGHLSIVTAISCLEGTPMVISADDNGCIKTWDIRSLQCYQTIQLSHRTVINSLIPMENIRKIAFIGCRVNFLEFDPYEV
jgi:WD40 repeat protein